MFCHITQNWRGRPLDSLEAVVNLIGSTTTAAGLRIRASLDAVHYEKGIVITDDEIAAVNLQPARLRGEMSWNRDSVVVVTNLARLGLPRQRRHRPQRGGRAVIRSRNAHPSRFARSEWIRSDRNPPRGGRSGRLDFGPPAALRPSAWVAPGVPACLPAR